MTGLPVGLRMALRDLARSKRRTFATMLGTVLALVLVLASVGMMSSILEAIRIQFDEVELADATVTVQDGSGAAGAIEAMDGVAAFEDVVAGQATILANGESYETALTGYEPGTAMHGFRGVDGESHAVPTDGILVGHALQDLLSVDVGDAVTVSTAAGDSQATIAGFVDEPMGTSAYASLDTASAMLPQTGVTSHSLLFAEDADRDAMRQAITDVDGVVAYQDSRAILSIVQQYLGLFYVFIGAMILLGAILALAVMYVTMAVNVVERTGELATLRAAGVPLRRVAGAIATENMLATLLGVPIGLLLGVWAAQAFMDTFNDDLFSLTVRWSWWALPAAALGVVLAALASQWPASRQIARVDIARVVRERAS